MSPKSKHPRHKKPPDSALTQAEELLRLYAHALLRHDALLQELREQFPELPSRASSRKKAKR